MRQLTTALMIMALLFGAMTDACEAGEIQGTVTVKSSLRPRAKGKVSDTQTGNDTGYGYGGQSTASDDSMPTLSSDQEVPYTVISVLGKNLTTTPHAYVIHQKNREFLPHVLPIVRGSSVLFANDDAFLHSIYSESPSGQFILAKYARGKKESRSFKTPGAVELFCGIHARMNAYIYVVENDFFAQPGKNRHFTIANLPAGTYTVRIWHPRANPQTRSVTVPATGAATLDVAL